MQLQKESARADQAEKTNSELQDEHQAAYDLVYSKDQLLELGQAEISQLRETLNQTIAQQEEQAARWEFHLLNCPAKHSTFVNFLKFRY